MNQPIHMPYTEAIKRLEEDLGLLRVLALEENPDAKKSLKEVEDAIAYLRVASLGGLSSLVSLVRQWGADKGITGPNAKATVASQYEKLLEEVAEIKEGIEKKDQHEIIDGIGDSTVVLILLADLAGVKFEQCLLAAYDEIKGRAGRMVDGVFVKDPVSMEPQKQDQRGCFIPAP